MDIDLKPLFRGEKISVSFEFSLDLKFGENGSKETESFSFKENSAVVSGEVKNRGGYMTARFICRTNYTAHCARCLAETEGELVFENEIPVVEKFSEYDGDEFIEINSSCKINLDDYLLQALVLSLPSRTLCTPECKGLCVKCGKNLNEAACNCDFKLRDPRWDILKNFKE